jgi:hypothetical protein
LGRANQRNGCILCRRENAERAMKLDAAGDVLYALFVFLAIGFALIAPI